MNIKFSPPDISELEIDEVTKALKSGWITTGPRVKELEKQIAEFVGAPKCVCLNSQTACAEMALRVLGIGEGDEVITSAYTYTATASVICHAGAKPILIDTQRDNFEMDYSALAAAVNEKTKAVIPVDLGGVPCDYDKIFDIVNDNKRKFRPSTELQEAIGHVIVSADAAHSFGAERMGLKAGNIADFSSFSFHAVKNFTTGEGGALTWRHIDGIEDDAIYRQLQLMSLHGQNKDALAKTRLGSWEYDIIGTWYKCNMTDIAAAVGIAQMRRYDNMLERRKKIIDRYDKAFKPIGIKPLAHYATDYSSSGHLYITRVPIAGEAERNEIITRMADKGIACNVHYKPLPMHTAYKRLGFDIKDFPNAYSNYANEITLPLHTCLTDNEVDYIIENFVSIVKDYANL